MFDTYVTIVGNVLTAPEWRRTQKTGSLVANFKVASTARRLNRETGQWMDGNSLRVRVNCWRRLAEGVGSSIMVGDPVVVVGRLYTRDWTDAEGNHRTLYELEAVAVGHDLARGRSRFARNRPAMATSELEDAEAEGRIRGEEADLVPLGQAPVRPGEPFGEDDDFGGLSTGPAAGYGAIPVGYDGLTELSGRPRAAFPASDDDALDSDEDLDGDDDLAGDDELSSAPRRPAPVPV